MLKFILVLFMVGLVAAILPYLFAIILVVLIIWIIVKINPVRLWNNFRLKRFEKKYYVSEEFYNLKKSISRYVQECNRLNNHIDGLKKIALVTSSTDYGKANYHDSSNYNYSRPNYKKHSGERHVYNCSRTICDNARRQPFKYVCKYFDIGFTEETLEIFEDVLNKFEAAKEGMVLLDNERERILNSISSDIPPIINKYGRDRFQSELGFRRVEFDTICYPEYKFQYVSPGGNASIECDVVMDIENLNKFVTFLSDNIKFRKSVAGQRALMTSALRKKILQRDKYTCQKCGNSKSNEPNLLLEVDHIMPLSKGGMTTEENLQILCWRCNRSKGAKIETE